MVTADALPRSDGQQAAANRKAEALRDAVESALAIERSEKSRYSIHQIKAFQAALPVHRDAVRRFGADHPVAAAVASGLRALARGCHRYEREGKVEAYRSARDCVSAAVCEVALVSAEGAAPTDALTKALEQEVLPAIAGLLRRIERSRASR